jgi:hypothetical protein
VRHLLGYKQGLVWLVGLDSPELKTLVCQVLNLSETVWCQWLAVDSHPPRTSRGKLSFLLTQVILAPGLVKSPGVDSMIAWRHYCRVYRRRFPEPTMINTRIVRDATRGTKFDNLADDLIWFWMLEMGYPVSLPYYLCHQWIILGLHLVREHITVEQVNQRLGTDDDMLARMLGGHVALSPLGTYKIMKLNEELAVAYPLPSEVQPGSNQIVMAQFRRTQTA